MRKLQDVYFAERQLLKALPKLAKNSINDELREAFTHHLQETEGQVDRLEKVIELIEKKSRGRRCNAILGIIAEGREVIEEVDDDAVRDAGFVAAGQAAEHYEIARYGTLIAWAELLVLEDVVELLRETLAEEKKADELLTLIAEAAKARKTTMRTASARGQRHPSRRSTTGASTRLIRSARPK
jgi:ferritin-like metal-binding protein YciE